MSYTGAGIGRGVAGAGQAFRQVLAQMLGQRAQDEARAQEMAYRTSRDRVADERYQADREADAEYREAMLAGQEADRTFRNEQAEAARTAAAQERRDRLAREGVTHTPATAGALVPTGGWRGAFATVLPQEERYEHNPEDSWAVRDARAIEQIRSDFAPPQRDPASEWTRMAEAQRTWAEENPDYQITAQGVAPRPGGRGAAIDPKDVDQVAGALSFRDALAQYKQYADEFNQQGFGDRARSVIPGIATEDQDRMVGRLQNIQTQLMFAVKEMEQLGALQEGEIKFVERMIGNALSRESLLRGPEYVEEQLAGLEGYLNRGMGNWARTKGYDLSQYGLGGSGLQGPQERPGLSGPSPLERAGEYMHSRGVGPASAVPTAEENYGVDWNGIWSGREDIMQDDDFWATLRRGR